MLLLMSIPVWSGETGLFTYEGGFFVKNGTSWKEYRPKDKPGVWATYTQYSQDDKYYYISNDNGSLAIPEKSINNFYRMEGGEWKVIYKTRVVYDHFSDSSVRLFCFPQDTLLEMGRRGVFTSLKNNRLYGRPLLNMMKMINSSIYQMHLIRCACLKGLTSRFSCGKMENGLRTIP